MAAVHGACLRGVEAVPVTVEVSLAGGMPQIQIVGMADAAVLEARSRIRCALRASGFEVPRKSITVNLAPGSVRKRGSGLDLPIAVAILAASGQIPADGLDGALFLGELGLDGGVRPVAGEVAYQVLARSLGLELVVSPLGTHVGIDGCEHGALARLSDLAAGLVRARSEVPIAAPLDRPAPPDLADVCGQEVAKRALAIAAVGGLGLMMVGPPGSGKSMLARRMPSILPPLEDPERLEALRIHSVAGEDVSGLLAGERPCRSPHHSVTGPGLVGGGRPVRPGEISLAHGGVLFLDEVPEMSQRTLQLLRQPLEEGVVRIVRTEGVYTLPARFQLLAAANPCPCGYLGDDRVRCTCPPAAVARYRSRLGGPLVDRIDMVVDVARPDAASIVRGEEGASSAEVAASVERGRTFAAWRRARSSSDADAQSSLDPGVSERLLAIARARDLTARGIERLSRVARAIADMDERKLVAAGHVLEAAMFRGRRDAP